MCIISRIARVETHIVNVHLDVNVHSVNMDPPGCFTHARRKLRELADTGKQLAPQLPYLFQDTDYAMAPAEKRVEKS